MADDDELFVPRRRAVEPAAAPAVAAGPATDARYAGVLVAGVLGATGTYTAEELAWVQSAMAPGFRARGRV